MVDANAHPVSRDLSASMPQKSSRSKPVMKTCVNRSLCLEPRLSPRFIDSKCHSRVMGGPSQGQEPRIRWIKIAAGERQETNRRSGTTNQRTGVKLGGEVRKSSQKRRHRIC